VVAQLDVTDQSSVYKAIRMVQSNFGRLDILVNNAGILIDKTNQPTKADPSILTETFETNVLGALRLCQAAIPLMLQND
jgi:NADP-dependent 3-hydroxy acid dehydrogenase YdfG